MGCPKLKHLPNSLGCGRCPAPWFQSRGDCRVDPGLEAATNLVTASLPTWGIRHVFPIDKVLPVVHYENEDGESWAWWPADDEELQAMESFYAATRTPGRPDVSIDQVFPINRSETD